MGGGKKTCYNGFLTEEKNLCEHLVSEPHRNGGWGLLRPEHKHVLLFSLRLSGVLPPLFNV